MGWRRVLVLTEICLLPYTLSSSLLLHGVPLVPRRLLDSNTDSDADGAEPAPGLGWRGKRTPLMVSYFGVWGKGGS